MTIQYYVKARLFWGAAKVADCMSNNIVTYNPNITISRIKSRGEVSITSLPTAPTVEYRL